jgi:hypothetical protein
MSETTAPAAAVDHGHDMIGNGSRWECRRCGRVAYRENGREWGTATVQPCADSWSPLDAIKRGAQQVATERGAR